MLELFLINQLLDTWLRVNIPNFSSQKHTHWCRIQTADATSYWTCRDEAENLKMNFFWSKGYGV